MAAAIGGRRTPAEWLWFQGNWFRLDNRILMCWSWVFINREEILNGNTLDASFNLNDHYATCISEITTNGIKELQTRHILVMHLENSHVLPKYWQFGGPVFYIKQEYWIKFVRYTGCQEKELLLVSVWSKL